MLPTFFITFEMCKIHYDYKTVLPISFNKFVSYKSFVVPLQPFNMKRKTNVAFLNKKLFKDSTYFNKYFGFNVILSNKGDKQCIQGSINYKEKMLNLKFVLSNIDNFCIQCSFNQDLVTLMPLINYLTATLQTILRK